MSTPGISQLFPLRSGPLRTLAPALRPLLFAFHRPGLAALKLQNRQLGCGSSQARVSGKPSLSATVVSACLCFALSSFAQVQIAQPNVIRSVTGQFIVRPAPPRDAFTRPPPASLLGNTNFIRLEPSLVAVSCERIKRSLCREIGAPSSWRGKIYVALYQAQSGQEPLVLTSDRYNSGWQYGLELPNLVERERYLQAITQVCLLEIANRENPARSAELPLWLVEGLTQELRASGELEMILPPPNGSAQKLAFNITTVNARRENPLESAHKILLTHPPLTFDQLSWPPEDVLDGNTGDAYRASAQLFLHELLRLKNGRACLRAMVSDLPGRLNWQLAFLAGFRGHFERPLDIEKWFALQVAHFTGRDLTQTWPVDETWQKLDQTLKGQVRTQSGTNDLPKHSAVLLQTVIRDWDRLHQGQAIRAKLAELDLLRVRAAPELIALVDEYRQALSTYLETQNKRSPFGPLFKKSIQHRAIQEVVKKLDELDARRLSLRPKPLPVATAGAIPVESNRP